MDSRMITILLALLVVVGLIALYGGRSTVPTATPTPPAATTPATSPPAQPTPTTPAP
jgi:hypothetical protein